MWYNYIKIALRNLIKDTRYTFINLLGLSLGLAATLMIIVFVKSEWTYDHFHSHKNEIHRLWVKEKVEGDILFNTVTPLVVGNHLKENFPDIQKISRYIQRNMLLRKAGETTEQSVHFAEPEFLEIFDFPLSSGVADLSDPSKILLSERLSKQLFTHTQSVGQTLTLQAGMEWRDFEVSGVFESIPANSSIQFDILMPYEIYRQGVGEQGEMCWTCVFGETYVLLPEGLSGEVMQTRTAAYFDEQVQDQYEAGEYIVGYQPLTDIHLNNDYPLGIVPVSDARYPLILSAIAFLILLLAGINYISLSIGKSLSRGKEVGIRKVVGAKPQQIIFQHWGEAIILTTLASLLAFALAALCFPFFNQLFGQQLTLTIEPELVGIMALVSVLLGLLSAIYPSMVLAGFKPISVLSGHKSGKVGNKQQILRWMTATQFFLSIVLIICTLTMRKQINYMTTQNLGYHKEGTLVVSKNSPERLSDQLAESRLLQAKFQSDLINTPYVKQVSTSNHALGSFGWMRLGYSDEETDAFRTFRMNGIDEHFVPLYGLEMVSGENFKTHADFNQNAVLVNETYLKTFDLSSSDGLFLQKPFDQFRIVGVVKDFHFQSMHTEIEPLVLAYEPFKMLQISPDLVFFDSPRPKYSFKLSTTDLPSAIAAVRESWRIHMPDQPFDFSFVEDDINTLYQSEIRLNRIVLASTIVAILIAILGLFGIIGISTARRRKEIGIRKVLGASTGDVLSLISKEFMILIAGSLLLAIPTGWYFMNQWLSDFAYSAQIGVVVFVMAGFIGLMVAFLTISMQTLRASRINPIETIRDE